MILIFDTETSGKYDFKAHWTAPHQPHLLQLACLLLEPTTLEEAGCFHCLVKPATQIAIEPGAMAAHGITPEALEICGISFPKAVTTFLAFAERATAFVGHNVDFDLGVMRTALHRAGSSFTNAAQATAFCTMRAMTPICKLRGPFGHKWPKLSEAYKHVTGTDLEGAHDALVDVRATATIYRYLKAPKPHELAPC